MVIFLTGVKTSLNFFSVKIAAFSAECVVAMSYKTLVPEA